MTTNKEIQIQKPLHHSYVVEGDEESLNVVLSELRELGYEHQGNPDFRVRIYEDVFGIDDARDLISSHLAKPVAGDAKFFIFYIPRILHEAQNALLKVLEEPSGSSHFFIIAPNSGMFLPTVLSRVEVLKDKGSMDNHDDLGDATEFLSLSIQDRLKFVQKMIKDKDKKAALIFLSKLEIVLHDKFKEGDNEGEVLDSVKEIIKFQDYLRGRSPSIKMILEHLALTLPKGVASDKSRSVRSESR